jgi:hypothetical protein
MKSAWEAGISPAAALEKANRGEPLTEAEYVTVNFGMLPQELAEAEEACARGETPWCDPWKPKCLILNWSPN